MTTQMQRKIKRMILDLEDLEEDCETKVEKQYIMMAIIYLKGIIHV